MGNQYTAYVGSYSYRGTAKGISIYDVDVDNGRFTKRNEVEVNNASYITVSRSGKYLYSIADEGVISFKIEADGNLTQLNSAPIKGMRGCYLYVDEKDKYIFVSGYHDGKATILELLPDGRVGKITDGVFHQGIGSVSDKSFRPRINCSMLTPDQKYLCTVDLGLDQVICYKFDHSNGLIRLVDILRLELGSAPRHITFSDDGKYMYLVSEIKNAIDVFLYEDKGEAPSFQRIQTIPTVGKNFSALTAASALKISPDGSHVLASNAGDNSAALFKRDQNTGLLDLMTVLPISGDYPKDITFFPDGKHLVSVNHVSGYLTFFKINYETGLLSMCNAPIKVNEPNCCLIVKNPID